MGTYNIYLKWFVKNNFKSNSYDKTIFLIVPNIKHWISWIFSSKTFEKHYQQHNQDILTTFWILCKKMLSKRLTICVWSKTFSTTNIWPKCLHQIDANHLVHGLDHWLTILVYCSPHWIDCELFANLHLCLSSV